MPHISPHAMPLPSGGFMPYLRLIECTRSKVTGRSVSAGPAQVTEAAALAVARHRAGQLAHLRSRP